MMRLVARPLPGMLELQLEPRADQRGYFARCFCRAELAEWGVEAGVEQANLSFSVRAGTLRGLHYQVGPSAETKVVTCVQGTLHDVVLDLRKDSPTYGRHAGMELSAANRRLLVIPEGCAHGFLTQEDATLLLYMVSRAYEPPRERAVRWNDPAFELPWPAEPQVISSRDAAIPDFDPGQHLAA
jgi:dTDP-4-dehydrorhamnose 3,5-epimerase